MYITGGYMKIEKMNKNQLIQSIQICDKNLNNPLSNREIWIAKHKNNIIDEELARVFTAYQEKINQLSMSITRLKQGF